ncbi:hypothetical protein [Nesterenkonia populi]|uniref:hypothetical protein n=1 Tax=Nesterenkonia populi TaxID=1591087 RepID=UPI0011BDC5DC|nr:hypothetical protein [Nesterenkonia populi]
MQQTPLWRKLERSLGEGFSPRYQWLWILPAGSIPHPEALQRLEERLLQEKDRRGREREDAVPVEVVGAKQLHAGFSEDRLVDVGLYPAPSGEILSLTEPKELDQGQYDGRDAVPAVSAHGMLVSAGLFGDLGGFDPGLEPEYSAARFCARAREVGAQAVIAPRARIYQQSPPPREALHRLGGALWLPAEQRRAQIVSRLADAPAFAVLPLWLGQWALALLRCLALICCKAPGAGLGQVGASAAGLLSIPLIAHLRRFRRQGRRAAHTHHHRAERPRRTAEPLSRAQLRAQRRQDVTAETLAPQARRGATSGNHEDLAEGQSLFDVGAQGGEFDEMPARRSEDRLGLFIVLTALTGVSLIGYRELLTAGVLGGGASLPVSPSIAEAWHQATSFLAADSLGERSAADPFSAVLLVLSVLSFGNASAVLLWVVILAAPLSAATAWWASGLVSGRAFHRILASLIWGLAPVLQIAGDQGRVGAVIAHILLPAVLVLAVYALQRRRAGASGLEPAAGAGLLLAVLCAAAPVLIVLAVLGCLAAGLLLGRAGRILWLLPLPALAIFGPMLFSALDRRSNFLAVLLAEPGRALPSGQAGSPAPLWQQLLGHSQAFEPAAGLPGAISGPASWLPSVLEGDFWALRLALLIGGPLLAVAVIAFIAAPARRALIPAGLFALAALMLSAAAARLTAGAAGTQLVPAHTGPLVSVVLLCLLVSAVVVLRTAGAGGRAGSFLPVASTLLVLAVFASAVFWAAPRLLPASDLSDRTVTAVHHEQVLVGPGSLREIPASAADQGTGPEQLRTLILQTSGETVEAELVAGRGRMLDAQRTPAAVTGLPLTVGASTGEPELRASEERVAELVSALRTPGSSDVGTLMEELAVGHILIPGGEETLTDAAETAQGLISVGPTDRGLLWRAEEPISWARIVTADGDVQARLPAAQHRIDAELSEDDWTGEAEAGEELFLELSVERARGWHAELDGEQLRAATESSTGEEELPWLRRFHLPDGADAAELDGSQLTVMHRSAMQPPILLGVGLLLVLLILVALPLPRSWRIMPVASREQLETGQAESSAPETPREETRA